MPSFVQIKIHTHFFAGQDKHSLEYFIFLTRQLRTFLTMVCFGPFTCHMWTMGSRIHFKNNFLTVWRLIYSKKVQRRTCAQLPIRERWHLFCFGDSMASYCSSMLGDSWCDSIRALPSLVFLPRYTDSVTYSLPFIDFGDALLSLVSSYETEDSCGQRITFSTLLIWRNTQAKLYFVLCSLRLPDFITRTVTIVTRRYYNHTKLKLCSVWKKIYKLAVALKNQQHPVLI